MNAGSGVKLAVAVVLLVAAGGLVLRFLSADQRSSQDFPEGTFWVCAGGHEFTLSLRQVAEFYNANPEARMTCPTCSAPAARAIRCPLCSRMFPRPDRGQTVLTCPHCGKQLPKATERLRD